MKRALETNCLVLALLAVCSAALVISSCSKAPNDKTEKEKPIVGPVKLNPHPPRLESKTIILRWNGKYNGDRFLTRIAERFAKEVKNLKIVKMWEVDPGTAAISGSLKRSEEVATKIAEMNPAIVISSQAD